MKKVLVYGAYGSGNAGDDYMMMQVLTLLEKNDIIPVFLTKPVWKHYFNLPQKKIRSIRFPLWADYSHANRALKAIHYMRFILDIIAVRNYDAAIFVGGGYTYEKFGNLRRIQFLSHFLRKHHIPYYLMGQTIGPLTTKEGRKSLMYICRNAEAVYVREHFSKELLERMGIPCTLSGDDAFLGVNTNEEAGILNGSCVAKAECTDRSRRGILVTVKDFPGYEQFRDDYFEYIRKFSEKIGEPVRILPFHIENEEEADRELYKYLTQNGTMAEICRPSDKSALEELFCSSKAVISSAYHAIVLGKIAGCVCQAWYDGPYYRMKMEGILDYYNREEHLCRPFSDLKEPGGLESAIRELEEICRIHGFIRTKTSMEDTGSVSKENMNLVCHADNITNRRLAAAVRDSWEKVIWELENSSNGK